VYIVVFAGFTATILLLTSLKEYANADVPTLYRPTWNVIPPVNAVLAGIVDCRYRASVESKDSYVATSP
jgi:hypothetical protein